jgi:hypothetical protein
MLGLWQVYVLHIYHFIENFCLYKYTSPLSLQVLQSRSCLFYLSCAQWQLNHLNGHKFDHHQVSASHIFYVWLHLVLYGEYVHSDDFLRLVPVACTILLYNHVYIWKVESRVQIADQCAPWKISNGAQNLVLHVLQF